MALHKLSGRLFFAAASLLLLGLYFLFCYGYAISQLTSTMHTLGALTLGTRNGSVTASTALAADLLPLPLPEAPQPKQPGNTSVSSVPTTQDTSDTSGAVHAAPHGASRLAPMNKSTELPAAPGPSPPSAAHPGSPPRPVPHNSTGAATELRARQARAAALAGFQWKLYSLYSGSLLSSASQRQVEQHYLQHNLTQQACYQRPPLASIRYNTIGGLANQLLSHLGALAMAEGLASRGLPVQVVLQPALSRTSFKSITPFVELPTSSLFDTKRMAHYWGPRGVTVLEQGASLDNCTKVHVDWLPSWPLPRNLAIKDSIERLGASIGAAVCKAVRNSTAHDLCVPLDFDGFLFTFNHSRSFPECEVAARGLFFCREVVTAAELVTEQLKTRYQQYNGLHLRIEGDWAAFERPTDVIPYLQRMKAAGFMNTTVLYVASGIFSYYNDSNTQALKERLMGVGICSSVLYKEGLLPRDRLQGLHPEQLALVDALVLAQAQAVVGSCQSTFTWLACGLRAMQGRTGSSCSWVDSDDVHCDYFKSGTVAFLSKHKPG